MRNVTTYIYIERERENETSIRSVGADLWVRNMADTADAKNCFSSAVITVALLFLSCLYVERIILQYNNWRNKRLDPLFQDVKIIGWLMTQQVKAALLRQVLEAPHMRLMYWRHWGFTPNHIQTCGCQWLNHFCKSWVRTCVIVWWHGGCGWGCTSTVRVSLLTIC